MKKMYPGAVTDENIRAIFENAGDFIARKLQCAGHTLYAYAIDGLTSGADTSEYVIRPISDNLSGSTMQALYEQALAGSIYNSVAERCAAFAWKGCKLAAAGDFETITFADDPQRQPGFLIKASDVEFLSPRKAEDAAQAVEDMSASEDAA